MKITFLGTGTSQGVPVIGCDCEVCQSLDYRDKRLRTSLALEVGGKHIVIDTGPDFRQQMLNCRATSLDAIVYTHQHKDHTGGLDDIRPFFFRQGMADIPLYARKEVIEQLKQEFAYIFADKKYPGVPSVLLHEVENKPFEVEGIPFVPIEVMHYKLPVFGYRIGNFTYITDANFISEAEQEKIRGSEILVLNALQIKEHISHFTLQEALDLIEKLRPKTAYLTHLSHRMGKHASVPLPKNVHFAHDGLQVEL